MQVRTSRTRPSVVPRGPWTTSLNWDLCATRHGEIRVPFRHHVRQGEKTMHSSLKTFEHFSRLPLELQHHMLSFCDNATLFQLMRASPVIRKEAAKLFWSDPTVQYRIQGSWVLSGGYSGLTYAALEAHKYMQYIIVELLNSKTTLHGDWVDLTPHHIKFLDEEEASLYAEHQIAAFWRTLRVWFPSLISVEFSTNLILEPEEEPLEAQTQLAEGCPNGVHVHASNFHLNPINPNRPRSRKLWRAIKSSDKRVSWELTEPSQSMQVVIPPIQERSGPVGKWWRWLHDKMEPCTYMVNARKLLLIQATEAYYQHTLKSPCVCPIANCGLQFEEPGQWTLHYVSTDERLHESAELCPPPCEMLREAFSEHDMRLERMRKKHKERLAEMRAEWGDEGSEQRMHVTAQFLQQLRDDPLCSVRKEPEESRFWRQYEKMMNSKERSMVLR